MQPVINASAPIEPPPASAPVAASPPVEKSAPDATKKPGKSSASNPSQRSNDDEFWLSRVGVFAFRRNPDPKEPPDGRARITVNHINSVIGDSPGLKARPVVVPSSGLAKFTIVRKEIDVQEQDMLKNGVFLTPDFLTENHEIVIVLPEKADIAIFMHSLQFVKEAHDKDMAVDPAAFLPVDIPFAIEENMGRLANKKREINIDLIGCMGLALAIKPKEFIKIINHANSDEELAKMCMLEVVTVDMELKIMLKQSAKAEILPDTADVTVDYAFEFFDGGRLTLNISAFVVGKEGGERREDYHRLGAGANAIYNWFGDWVQEIRPNSFGTGIQGTGIVNLNLKVPLNREIQANKILNTMSSEGKNHGSTCRLTGIKVRWSATLAQARTREGLVAVIESDSSAISEAKLSSIDGQLSKMAEITAHEHEEQSKLIKLQQESISKLTEGIEAENTARLQNQSNAKERMTELEKKLDVAAATSVTTADNMSRTSQNVDAMVQQVSVMANSMNALSNLCLEMHPKVIANHEGVKMLLGCAARYASVMHSCVIQVQHTLDGFTMDGYTPVSWKLHGMHLRDMLLLQSKAPLAHSCVCANRLRDDAQEWETKQQESEKLTPKPKRGSSSKATE